MADHPFDLLERELDAAARRRLAAPPEPGPARRRRWARPRLLVSVAAAGLGLSAAAWAAGTLLSDGEPVPYRYGAPPQPDTHYGTTVPGTVKLLADDVPDPDGGLPWGLRTFETSRGYGCIQVGRVQEGRLGVLALVDRGRVRERGLFHALRTEVLAQATTCVPLDGAGHAFLATHQRLTDDATAAGCAYRPGGSGLFECPADRARTVDAGLLGPEARTVTFRRDGRSHTTRTLGAEGGYLVVQRDVPPAMTQRRLGGRTVSSAIETWAALTPGANVVTRVTYADGTVCRVRPTISPRGACMDAPGFTPVPQPRPADTRARVRAFAAPSRRGMRIRFRAPLAVRDGRSAYNVFIRRPGGGFGTDLARNVEAGELVRTTITVPSSGPGRRPGLRHGRTYEVVVSLRVQPPYPRITGGLGYPGYPVGTVRVTVP